MLNSFWNGYLLMIYLSMDLQSNNLFLTLVNNRLNLFILNWEYQLYVVINNIRSIFKSCTD